MSAHAVIEERKTDLLLKELEELQDIWWEHWTVLTTEREPRKKRE